jgi:hypothetical protein
MYKVAHSNGNMNDKPVVIPIITLRPASYFIAC